MKIKNNFSFLNAFVFVRIYFIKVQMNIKIEKKLQNKNIKCDESKSI